MSRSHRGFQGTTGDLMHRTGPRTIVRFSCMLCPIDANLYTVPHGRTVVQEQARHASSHPLDLRLAVEALVKEHTGTYTQALGRGRGSDAVRLGGGE